MRPAGDARGMDNDDIREPGYAERDDSETSPQTGGGEPVSSSDERIGQGTW